MKPDQATLVPERREELTTEGGLDVCGQRARVAEVVERLRSAGISVSLFLDPDPRQIEAAAGSPSMRSSCTPAAMPPRRRKRPRNRSSTRSNGIGALVRQAGLTLHAGHGLTYRNVRPIAAVEGMHELNIGHSIVARAIMVGFQEAVREMKRLVS